MGEFYHDSYEPGKIVEGGSDIQRALKPSEPWDTLDVLNMPKVISFTPSWLSKPAPSHEIFVATQGKALGGQTTTLKAQTESSRRNKKPGPRRTIAHRGSEIFVAVGKEIRWADLVYLKDNWEDKQPDQRRSLRGERQSDDATAQDDECPLGYRTIKTRVADDIRQLIISPNSNYLAILTTHTVHIAILPDASHLSTLDTSSLRLKTYTLGPTTHVTSQPAVASALWHPLGVNGSCIVTVTEDAVVRVWELSTADSWSFDRPTLGIDLKKLADGTSLDQDFGASISGMSQGFSPDSFEMEVASASFASRGSGGWSPMTLWIAMREGDVYALCPLLPERWAPPPTLIPSLTISIVTKAATMEDDPDIAVQRKLLGQQQLAWMADLDDQEPVAMEAPAGQPPTEIYTRPQKPGRIPRLQGPFEFEFAPEDSEDDLDSLLTDIYVIGPRIDVEGLMSGEEDEIELEDAEVEGLSVGVVCLASSSGRVTVCLDLDGVEAQWLPNSKAKNRIFPDTSDPPNLLTFQVLGTLKAEEIYDEGWPMFSPDVTSKYSIFSTHASGITSISFAPWVFRLESELQGNSDPGTDFRIDLLVKGQNSIRERLITEDVSEAEPIPLSACQAIRDPDLGYFLISANSSGPIALNFEVPDEELEDRHSRSPAYESAPEPQPLLLCAPRPVYQPPPALSSSSAVPKFLQDLRHSRYKRLVDEPVRLSPATLTILTDAHKILSEETHRLGTAAAELFRRYERLQVDLRDQIVRANEVAYRVEAVVGGDTDIKDPTIPSSGNSGLEERLKHAKRRQQSLASRFEKLRRMVARGGKGLELSDKEKIWFEEVTKLSQALLPPEGKGKPPNDFKAAPYWQRYETVKDLKYEILGSVQENDNGDESKDDGDTVIGTKVKVPSEIRKQKMKEVMVLLERETALVEGVKGRVERLSLA